MTKQKIHYIDKGMTTKIFVVSSLILLVASCGQPTPIPESLFDIKEKVARLDSSLTAMYGWEPQDSTYKRSLDTLLSITLTRMNADFGKELPAEADYIDQQKGYDEANETWAEFKRLCDAEKYKQALDKKHIAIIFSEKNAYI